MNKLNSSAKNSKYLGNFEKLSLKMVKLKNSTATIFQNLELL